MLEDNSEFLESHCRVSKWRLSGPTEVKSSPLHVIPVAAWNFISCLKIVLLGSHAGHMKMVDAFKLYSFKYLVTVTIVSAAGKGFFPATWCFV